jgi:hypothetical protein
MEVSLEWPSAESWCINGMEVVITARTSVGWLKTHWANERHHFTNHAKEMTAFAILTLDMKIQAVETAIKWRWVLLHEECEWEVEDHRNMQLYIFLWDKSARLDLFDERYCNADALR